MNTVRKARFTSSKVNEPVNLVTDFNLPSPSLPDSVLRYLQSWVIIYMGNVSLQNNQQTCMLRYKIELRD